MIAQCTFLTVLRYYVLNAEATDLKEEEEDTETGRLSQCYVLKAEATDLDFLKEEEEEDRHFFLDMAKYTSGVYRILKSLVHSGRSVRFYRKFRTLRRCIIPGV